MLEFKEETYPKDGDLLVWSLRLPGFIATRKPLPGPERPGDLRRAEALGFHFRARLELSKARGIPEQAKDSKKKLQGRQW
jgi:hypothetical protein